MWRRGHSRSSSHSGHLEADLCPAGPQGPPSNPPAALLCLLFFECPSKLSTCPRSITSLLIFQTNPLLSAHFNVKGNMDCSSSNLTPLVIHPGSSSQCLHSSPLFEMCLGKMDVTKQEEERDKNDVHHSVFLCFTQMGVQVKVQSSRAPKMQSR